MIFTTIGLGLLAFVAASLAVLTRDPRASELWSIAMIGLLALAAGAATTAWASQAEKPASWKAVAKGTVFAMVAIFAAPPILAAIALFAFALLPSVVITLPIIGAWTLGERERADARPPMKLTPRLA